MWARIMIGFLIVAFVFAIWAAWMERRPGILLVPIPYVIVIYINAFIYLEQFVKEVLLQNKNLVWFKAERVIMPIE